MSTSWWCSNSFCCRVSEPVEHYSGQVSVTVCPGRWNSHRRCSTWLYVQTCLALHSANWKNGRCNPWWRFLLLYEPKSVSHTFLSVHVHLINTAADKTVQHQLSATTPSQRYCLFFFYIHFIHKHFHTPAQMRLVHTTTVTSSGDTATPSDRMNAVGIYSYFPQAPTEWDY